jgi:hypothetical protein
MLDIPGHGKRGGIMSPTTNSEKRVIYAHYYYYMID